MSDTLENRVSTWLDALCDAHPDRHVGGAGNDAANALFARVASEAGLSVERERFQCLDWRHGDAWVEAGGERTALAVGPYSPPCDATARLVAADSVETLEAADADGSVLLLHGEIAAHQLIPRAYPFFQLPEQHGILDAIEAARPLAIVAATGIDPGLAGSLHPFPLVEDGDFPLPSAYLAEEDAAPLLEAARDGAVVRLRIDSERVGSSAEQVVATADGERPGRVLVTAHIDSKYGTPGALDNATGVAVLMSLAHLLPAAGGRPSVELVPLNGEDDYAAPGQMVYLRRNEGLLGDVRLVVNIDGAAWTGHGAEFSFYSVPDDLADTVRDASLRHPLLAEGTPWPQGDHSIFAMRGIPAVAITSEDFASLSSQVTHTAADTRELADPAAVVAVARFVADIVRRLG